MDWGSTWDFLWHFLIIFAWIAYLLVLFQILYRPLVARPHDIGRGEGALGGLPVPVAVAHGGGLPAGPRQGDDRAGA